ncbi:SOS response-associated peptidase [Caulobacter endophyticus]|uniref:SOS response-associated peptidase n=1 Tax=Caulobacter endophyticus TaxID=2172652 RepID=UPI00240FB6F6|nr:SOS response-associated peptidase family protein [Caulobacter endophyticus]MDG2531030.1 SOS response-associated peptidase family protein [Caulobacter endophyticus]
MCNIYELEFDIFGWAQAHEDLLGRHLTLPGGVSFADANIDLTFSQFIYPDYRAPIVRRGAAGADEVHFARWGMPSPIFVQKEAAKKRAAGLEKKGVAYDFDELLRMEPDKGITNLRNLESPHWRRWHAVDNRCVVPITSFSEPDQVGGSLKPVWFARTEERPFAYFAGVWTEWACVRKIKTGWEGCDLFGFLTTEANEVVSPFHSKAMPVFLTTPEEVDTWLTAPWEEAVQLQRPLSAGGLRVIDPPMKRAA